MMGAGALAIVLGPNILFQERSIMLEPTAVLQHMALSNRVISKVIEFVPVLFVCQSVHHSLALDHA
jgi:hypothetical protein